MINLCWGSGNLSPPIAGGKQYEPFKETCARRKWQKSGRAGADVWPRFYNKTDMSAESTPKWQPVGCGELLPPAPEACPT